MMDDRWLSPLSHRKTLTGSNELQIRETPWLHKLILRGDIKKISRAVSTAIGIKLSSSTSSFTDQNGIYEMAIGPDEWLIISADKTADELISQLDAKLKNHHYQAVDVSDFYTTIDVLGTQARNLISKIAVVDMHRDVFLAGSFVASVMWKLPVWMQNLSDNKENLEMMRIHIRRSHADHLWCLLANAGKEYAIDECIPEGKVPLHFG